MWNGNNFLAFQMDCAIIDNVCIDIKAYRYNVMESAMGEWMMERKEVSKSVLKRLPGYLAYLKGLPEGSMPYISATALANALGMGEVQVRKDLAMVSDGGRPKIGYQRDRLIDDIEQFLGYDNTTAAVLIGAGKLGQALLG